MRWNCQVPFSESSTPLPCLLAVACLGYVFFAETSWSLVLWNGFNLFFVSPRRHQCCAGCSEAAFRLCIQTWFRLGLESKVWNRQISLSARSAKTHISRDYFCKNWKVDMSKGPSTNKVSHFSVFLTPWQFFCSIHLQFWPISDPFPPSNCRHRLWTICIIFNIDFDIWRPAKMLWWTQKKHDFLNLTS